MRGSVQPIVPSPPRPFRAAGGDRRSVGAAALRWVVTVVAVVGATDRMGVFADEAGPLPPVVRTKQRTFSIPFRLPAPSSAEAAPRQIVLDVSRDLGISWSTAGQVAPSTGSFTFTADADGEYWFRLRSIDSQGRLRGAAGPDMRVVVDAAGPKLVGRAWKGADGEVICRFAAADDSIALESVVVEYRSAVEPKWKRLAAQPVLARESPAHLLGEEIWWAGEKTNGLVVRVTLTDSSGNPVTKQFSLEGGDPRVDQAALARELGVPPLPGDGGGLATSPAPTPADAPSGVAFPGQPLPGPNSTASVFRQGDSLPGSAWPAERVPAWSPESASSRAPSSVAPSPGGMRNPLRRPSDDPARAAATPTSPFQAASAGGGPLSFTASRPNQTEFASAATPAAAPPAGQEAGLPAGIVGAPGVGMEYRGRPLQIVASRSFTWDYDLPAEKPAGRPRIELWGTRDGGITWQRFARDEDAASPIDVTLAEPGLYGFRLEITAGDDAGESPRSGELPDSWLGIDETAPEVEILSVVRDELRPPSSQPVPGGPSQARAIVIRYSVRDPLLVPQATEIGYSSGPDGPFVPIADRLEPTGEHRWIPDRGVPARVFLRVTARDVAGNVGKATTPEAVVISSPRAVGRLGGVRPSSSDAAP